MALYLRFLIIWNNNEFSAPAKNSDWVQARGAVDQSESFLSFMWTWKKRIKVFEVREKYMTECASNTKLSEDIWKDDGYFISVLFYNKALPPATGALNGLIIHTHIWLGLEDTRPRAKWVIPRCLHGDLVLSPTPGLARDRSVIVLAFLVYVSILITLTFLLPKAQALPCVLF